MKTSINMLVMALLLSLGTTSFAAGEIEPKNATERAALEACKKKGLSSDALKQCFDDEVEKRKKETPSPRR